MVVARDPVEIPDPFRYPIEPMRAAEGAAPAGSAWAFEFDLRGQRTIAYLRHGRVQLFGGASSRPITSTYPELQRLAELVGSRGELVLDGTIVADGRPGNTLLRKRMSRTRPSQSLIERTPVHLYLSDVLHIDGAATLELPYRQRRELLAGLDLTGLPARVNPYYLDTDGELLLGVARQHGLPGVLAKRLESRYLPGRLSRVWIRTPAGRVRGVLAPAPDASDALDHPDSDVLDAPDSAVPEPAEPSAVIAEPSAAIAEPSTGPGPVEEALDPVALNEAVRLAQAEVRALRAQISAHFVYNALTTIAVFVRTDPARARDLLADFAEYTRYSFRAGAETTTLRAELANIDCYLSLEQARFDDRLRVDRQVQAGLGEVVLPFLTVQPLVEHAVRYGIEGAPGGGTLSITAVSDGPDCVITVAQDVVAPAEQFDEITADLRARLESAGHAQAVEVRCVEAGSSVSIRVPR